MVRVIVAGQLSREERNSPLHLFSASPTLVAFGSEDYRRRSETTSLLLRKLFERLKGEDYAMSYTMEDFKRDFFREHFARLKPKEREEVLQSLLAGLPTEEVRRYLDRLTADRPVQPRKARRKR